MAAKSVWYDWFGGNEWLFTHINGIKGEWYESLMVMASRSADHHNFPFVLLILLCFAFFDYGNRKIRKRGGAAHCLIAWLGVFCVIVASYAVDGLAVKTIKNYFEYPRPYVVLGPETVTILEYRNSTDDDFHSFPSGHVSFITVVIVSLWPVLSSGMRKFGMAFIGLVAWSRIAEGMHFPADVVAAFLLSLCIVLVLREIIYAQLLKLKLKC